MDAELSDKAPEALFALMATSEEEDVLAELAAATDDNPGMSKDILFVGSKKFLKYPEFEK